MHSRIINQAQGFTLIEVMVTVLILSLGLLGLAAMQLNALKNAHGSQLRNQATTLAYEIGERIRSNRAAAMDDHYTIAAGEAPATTPDCEALLCAANEMADYDLGQWKSALVLQLPSGEGAIERSGDLLTVRIFWDELRNQATGTGCDPDNPADLACYSMSFIP